MVICCDPISSVSMDIRHHLWWCFELLQISNLWFITVYSIRRGWFVISVNVGLVTGLSLFMRPFLEKFPSCSPVYINQKCRQDSGYLVTLISHKRLKIKRYGNWWRGLGRCHLYGKWIFWWLTEAFSKTFSKKSYILNDLFFFFFAFSLLCCYDVIFFFHFTTNWSILLYVHCS